jgi:hypothetical protein
MRASSVLRSLTIQNAGRQVLGCCVPLLCWRKRRRASLSLLWWRQLLNGS